MSLLQKSAPALLYGGVAAAAVGAAVLSAAFQPAVDHTATVRANSECEAILSDKKPAILLQKIGCCKKSAAQCATATISVFARMS